MKIQVGFISTAIVLSIFILSPPSSLAVENRYTEDFTTSLYEDLAHTTANWDTGAGELGLYPFQPTLIGSSPSSDGVKVVIAGDHAYMAFWNPAGGNMMKVFDISDPANPVLIGGYGLPNGNTCKDIAVSGNIAYLALDGSGIRVLDISDPTNPTSMDTYNTNGSAYDIAISGDYALVADEDHGLQIMDISDPTNLTRHGYYHTPGLAHGVAVSGDYAFVADYWHGLQIIDFSDPTSPVLIGSYNTEGPAYKVVVEGDHAFVACYTYGLHILDITDPTNPTLLGTCNTPGYALDVAISGDCAYVADRNSGLQIIDITDPTNPTLLETCDATMFAYGVAVSGEHVFVADKDYGLRVIDIADPVPPVIIGSSDIGSQIDGLVVAGDYAFTLRDGLIVYDISDPTNPIFLGNTATPGSAYDVAVSGDHAFVADYLDGLSILDITDPANPALLGNCDTPSQARGVAVSGDHAFVADCLSGLQIIDITDPTNPTILGSYDTPDGAISVSVDGDHAFVADASSGLQIIDITNPTNPTFLGSYDTPGFARDVVISGDYAFVADDASGLQIIDISYPTNPTLLGSCVTPNEAADIVVSGDYAFVATMWGGLQVIDISDPTNPTLLSNCDTLGRAHDVAVSGDHVYVADFYSGLQVIKVFEHKFHWDGNVGQSLFVDTSSDSIFRTRLTATQIDSVGWELSADGGINWQDILPGTSWNRTDFPGNDLLWRSTFSWTSPACDPTVTDLEIEWLDGNPGIIDIVDVPDDQGGLVQVQFTRSGLDFSDETELPISNYGFWRLVDDVRVIDELNSVRSLQTADGSAGNIRNSNTLPVITHESGKYIQSMRDGTAFSFPPGTWELVGNLPATQQETYTHAVPTTADSSASGTNYCVFVLTAETTTPPIWYVSEPDSGYSLDNIAPAVPTNLAVAYHGSSSNELSWDPCPDADFQCFHIYRSDDPDFVPSPSDLVHSLTGTYWADPEYYGWDVYYKVSALDIAGNESDPASPEMVSGVTDSLMPQAYLLYPNVPNPFNPSTSIRYDVPAGGGVVTFCIYDLSGRLVQTVLDGPQTAGQKVITWNGKDNRGQSVVSGVYFYRLQAPGYDKTFKMVMLR